MKIPEIITRYLDASNRFDANAAADCFCADGHVHDENHDHRGQESIRKWISDYTLNYQPHAEVVTAKAQGEALLLTVRTSGSFPGSPIDLDYTMALRDGKISSLNVS
ncbi:MAG TPA: nuclear transport factor 2 family protein [Opitutaceae bacterium]|nr:nuclear transport factor 2 family protein [Opitutaceae bacterium]